MTLLDKMTNAAIGKRQTHDVAGSGETGAACDKIKTNITA